MYVCIYRGLSGDSKLCFVCWLVLIFVEGLSKHCFHGIPQEENLLAIRNFEHWLQAFATKRDRDRGFTCSTGCIAVNMNIISDMI